MVLLIPHVAASSPHLIQSHLRKTTKKIKIGERLHLASKEFSVQGSRVHYLIFVTPLLS